VSGRLRGRFRGCRSRRGLAPAAQEPGSADEDEFSCLGLFGLLGGLRPADDRNVNHQAPVFPPASCPVQQRETHELAGLRIESPIGPSSVVTLTAARGSLRLADRADLPDPLVDLPDCVDRVRESGARFVVDRLDAELLVDLLDCLRMVVPQLLELLEGVAVPPGIRRKPELERERAPEGELPPPPGLGG
jgi:hypothetical protein